MLSGFACDDYWFPSPLNLTVLHERGGSQYGCNQLPDSFEFPVELQIWNGKLMFSINFLFRLEWRLGSSVCVYVCVYTWKGKAKSHCSIKQGTDGNVSSRYSSHIPYEHSETLLHMLLSIPLSFKSPELQENQLHCILLNNKNFLTFCLSSTFLPIPWSLELVGYVLQTKHLKKSRL